MHNTSIGLKVALALTGMIVAAQAGWMSNRSLTWEFIRQRAVNIKELDGSLVKGLAAFDKALSDAARPNSCPSGARQ